MRSVGDSLKQLFAPAVVLGSELVVHHRGRRDIWRVRILESGGVERTAFVKQIFKSRLKDGVLSFLKRGSAWSKSRTEFENYRALRAAGIGTAEPIAYAEEMRFVWERGSMLATGAAPGVDLEAWLEAHADASERRALLTRLGAWMRQVHDRGFGFPDFFSRHIYVNDGARSEPTFSLIDVARLDHRRGPIDGSMRSRDLAALNISVPLSDATAQERLVLLRAYEPDAGVRRALRKRIGARTRHLLKRRKFSNFDPRTPRAITRPSEAAGRPALAFP